jgi:uncharacterized protein (TIGR03435 family)
MKLLYLSLLFTGALCAQGTVAFEAASVKPNLSGEGAQSSRSGPGSIELRNNTLKTLIKRAYAVSDFAFSGPAWLEQVHFDVVAKYPQGVDGKRLPELLQALLAERFKLAVHREPREVPGFVLAVDSKGLKIKPVEPGPSGTSYGSSMVQGTSIPMSALARMLSEALQRPVRDQTNVEGLYTVKLRWLPDGPLPENTDDMSQNVYSALQEIGLKLQVQKVTVETVVVDHAEREPSGN